MRVRSILRLAVDAHHLLARSVRHAGENARLGDRGVALVFEHAAHSDALVAKVFQQHAPGFVVADDADGKNIHAEIGEIIGGVGAAAGDDRALAMLENQHRRFARHARNLAEDEFVGDQVAQHRDGDLGKRLDDLPEAVGFFGMLGHQRQPCQRFSHARALSFFDHAQHGIQGVSGVGEFHPDGDNRKRLQGGEVARPD